MPGGRPPGTTGTPTQRRCAARLEADFPEYHPVATMAEGAIRLAELAKEDDALWPDAVAASDKVAAYIVPKLKAVEHSGQISHDVVLFRSDGDL